MDRLDVDALLEVESSSDGDGVPELLERSIDDILKDAEADEEFDSAQQVPSPPPARSPGFDRENGSVWEEKNSKLLLGTAPGLLVAPKPTPRPGAAFAAATAASRLVIERASSSSEGIADTSKPTLEALVNPVSSAEAFSDDQATDHPLNLSLHEQQEEAVRVADVQEEEQASQTEELVELADEPSSEEAGEEELLEAEVQQADEDYLSDGSVVDVAKEEDVVSLEESTSCPGEQDREGDVGHSADEPVTPAGDSAESREELSPLEEAERIESGAASSGFHLEEGAAARPMQLERIQRGPPAIGLLQLDYRGPISFALTSMSTVREHGNPRALAIHPNAIAVGMSKGTIILAPSKYSATRSADDNETRVVLLTNSAAPVTVLSFSLLGDLLLAGYASGTVVLWDVAKSAVAKAITGEHESVVVHATFVGHDASGGRQLKAITADCKGVVMLHTFTLIPVLRRYSVASTCLLDGQRTGVVLSLSSLLPDEVLLTSPAGNPSQTGSSVANDVGRKFLYDGSSADETGGLVVFVTSHIVLVFRLVPRFEVCAKLSRPEGVQEGYIPYASWKRIQVKSDTATNDPLLGLAWGKKVFILQLHNTELVVQAQWDIESKAAGLAWFDEQMLIVATSKSELRLYTKEGVELERAAIRDEQGKVEPLVFHSSFLDTCNNPEKVFANSLGVRGAAIYCLGSTRLWRARLLPWHERIKALQEAGDWMGAFQIAMELYDGKARGVTGLPIGLDALQQAIKPHLLALLSAYIDEAFAYVRLALNGASSANQEQYVRLGGVAIEFCVHISRTDVLFESVFRKFEEVGQAATFLELLEPYILKDMLPGLAPEIMQSLVEHYSRKGWVQRVEQCILHMDIASLDFNQVVKLCREHGLYSALIYLSNKGLNDFQTPVEELLNVAQDENSPNARYYGYKLLVYLKYCFSGLAFPPGRGLLPADQLLSLSSQLLDYLLDPGGSSPGRNTVYPRLRFLLDLDAAAALDVLNIAFRNEAVCKNFVQKMADALVHIVETMHHPSKMETSPLLKSLACYCSENGASVPPTTLQKILEHFCVVEANENLILGVLKAVKHEDWDPDAVLQLVNRAQFWQVAALIHTRKQDHPAALTSHVKDSSRWLDTFHYAISMLETLQFTDLANFRAAILTQISQLVQQHRHATLYLILKYFFSQFEEIVNSLRSSPRSLYFLLRAIMEIHSYQSEPSPEAAREDIDKNEPWGDRIQLASMLENSQFVVNDEIVEYYLELMCQFEANAVLKFVQVFETYRLEQCLKICQKYGIKEAAAFLLERVGDVGSALTLTLEGLNDLFHSLDRSVSTGYSSAARVETFPEAVAISAVKDNAISLCQRNTFRLDKREAETLWFHLLDRFVHPLKSLVSQERRTKHQEKGSQYAAWEVLAIEKALPVYRRLLSSFIKDVVAGMVGYVAMHEILNKIISDHGNHELGDFKATILDMLTSYGYELSILGTAKKIIEADMFHNIVALRRERGRAFVPKDVLCCVCRAEKAAPMHVFSCGHLSHLDCLAGNSKFIYCPACSVHEFRGSPLAGSFVLQRQREETGKSADDAEQSVMEAPTPPVADTSRFQMLKSLQQRDDTFSKLLDAGGPKLRLAPPSKSLPASRTNKPRPAQVRVPVNNKKLEQQQQQRKGRMLQLVR